MMSIRFLLICYVIHYILYILRCYILANVTCVDKILGMVNNSIRCVQSHTESVNNMTFTIILAMNSCLNIKKEEISRNSF